MAARVVIALSSQRPSSNNDQDHDHHHSHDSNVRIAFTCWEISYVVLFFLQRSILQELGWPRIHQQSLCGVFSLKLVALLPNELPPLFIRDQPDSLMILQGTDDESHQHSHSVGDHAHSDPDDREDHDGHSHDHSHHGHGHGHSHSHTNLNAVQKLIQRVSKAVGIAAIADAWRENLTVVCVSSVLLLLGALAPFLFPNLAATSSLQTLLVVPALPLTGV